MAIDFPSSPTNGQTFTSGSVTYTWDGTKWTAVAAGGGGSGDIIIEGNTSAEVIDTGSDGRFVVTTEGTEALRVDSAQRVGIGVNPATFDSTSGRGVLALNGSTSVTLTAGVGGSAKAAIQHDGTNALLYNIANGSLALGSNNTERARIDSSGRLLVGTSSARTNIFNESWLGNVALNVEGANAYGTAVNIVNNYNGNGYSFLNFLKSNTTSVGSNTIVASGDTVGLISFQGNDGTEFVQAAAISAVIDATPGANNMPGRLTFSTTASGASSPTERMRISQNGEVSSYDSSGNGIVSRSSKAAGATDCSFLGLHSATGTSNGTISFIVRTNGNVQNTNNSYTSISDIKLKENIVDASSQWDDIKALRPVNYNLKPETGAEQHTQLGLIAQEVELVSPGLVLESPDRDAEGNDLGTVTKSVNYSVLYMKAVKALQEAMERIETLEAKVAALENPTV